ncbi:MAG: DUF3144 domain-containing protein [Candidatus Thiodiazotropha sp.]|jgi:DNA-binding NarL/FixJ family response regulator
MTDKSKQVAEFTALVERFVKLANEIKEEGKPINMISMALMSASATYGTYVAAGNEGYLKPSGVDKLVELYRAEMTGIQEIKQQLAKDSGRHDA